MTLKPDHLMLLIASMVGLVLVTRSRSVMAQQRTSQLMPNGPETIFWGGTPYNDDASGAKYSATGADVRARR